MRSLVRSGLLALALLVPAVALADPKDDARRHFMAGLEAAQADQYEVALQHFLAAQDAYPHPTTTYNIARSYYDLGDLPNALTYFRLYQDAAPDKAADVAPTIAVIEARLGQERGTTTATSGPVGPPGAGAATEEELARLQGIAAELEALAEALQFRQAESTPLVGVEPEPGTIEPGTPEAMPELPEQGFLSDAYERVVVTASRYGQEPLDSPSTVSIITAEDIRLSGASTIPELLRRVVGVDTMQLAAGHTDVSIRGFNRELSNKVLVLVDGRSTYLDFMGTTLWETIPVTLEEIERIEVIRGPGSAVYGANAVTGVINIITRTPGEGENHVLVEAGHPEYVRGTGVVTGRVHGIGYRFSGGYKRQARWGQDFEMDDHSAAAPFFDVDAPGAQTLMANGRLEGTFGKRGYASLSAGFAQSLIEFYNIGALGDYGIRDTHTYLRGDIAWEPVHLRVFWNADDGFLAPWYEPVGDPRQLDTDMDADTVDVEVEASGQFASGEVTHRLNGGLGYRYKRLADFVYAGQQTGDEPIQENHFSGFVSEEASWEWLKVVGTFRVDVHPNLSVAQTLSPRGAAIFRVAENTAVRVGGGSAFRAPTMVENYMDFQLGTGVDALYIQDFGDIELKPERIITAELGVHDESTLYHTADVALYYNRLTNIIALTELEPTALPYDPDIAGWQAGRTGWENQDLAYDGFGVEAEAEFFPTDGLDVYVNFNWTHIIESEIGRDTSTSPVKFNVGAMYRTPFRTDLSASISYVSKQTWQPREFDSTGQIVVVPTDLPARTLLTARVAVRPTKDQRVEIAGTIWNATALWGAGDRGWQEHPKGQLIGPRVYGTVAYRF